MKVFGPAILEALAECLHTVYWYKNDLRSFLVRAAVPDADISALPWDDYKRRIARELVERLARNPATGMPVLERLMSGLIDQDDGFPHLARLDDGRRKVEDARQAHNRLKDLLGKESLAERAERARAASRLEAERVAAQAKERTDALGRLNARFITLCSSTDPQRRGFDFQTLLRDLFAMHDLDPRGSFARRGEQTDGSIHLDGTVLLVEARWTEQRTAPAEVREFRSKVHDKLDNTLGLMVSMAGFTDEAIAAAPGGGRMVVVLMDGLDLARIFQGIDDLVEVLRRKLRHAAEQGHAMYRAGA